MSANLSIILDDDGEPVDWIEIYNPSDVPLNLQGFGLSDDPDSPYKWIVPSFDLDGEGFCIIFASGKDRRNPDAGPMHTNFKIDRDGEALVLTAPNGDVADDVPVPELPDDVSWGRVADGALDWAQLRYPTPGTANIESENKDTVVISQTTGFYTTPVSVTISTESADTVIRYTTDSSAPTPASAVYNGALSIDTTTVLRARTFTNSGLPGPITTVTYSFEEHPETIVPEYFITCEQSDFETIYADYEEDIYIPATLTFDGMIWPDVRVRIRGDDSRDFPKKSLKVRFDTEPFSNGADVLNFNAEYYDRSYLSQYLSSYVMHQAGYPVFDAEYARLYLNGKFLGLYLRIENIDERFLADNDLDPAGNLYKATYDNATMSRYDFPDSLWEKKTNTDIGIDDLAAFIDSLNSIPDANYYQFAHERMDYDRMIDILALNMIVANGSTYYHNYFMYHDIRNSGKWTMLPWDMDKTFGVLYGYELSYQRSSPTKRADNPFVERALLDESMLDDIMERVTELTRTVFNDTSLLPVVDSLRTVLASSVMQDTTDDIDDITEWWQAIMSRREFIENRGNNLIYQFTNLPRPFRVERTPDILVRNTPFTWHPARDPAGDHITYTFSLSTVPDFTHEIIRREGIADTTYTLTYLPSPGIYYWRVTATDGSSSHQWYDGSNLCDGFESWNRITIKEAGYLPPLITGDMVLDREDSPYLVSEDITVSEGSTLTIPAGVELAIEPSVQITVHGALQACGNSENPVVFRESVPDSRWGTLLFDSAEGRSALTHVVISGASSGDDMTIRKAAVSSISSSLLLDHVQFVNNLHCLFVREGDVTVENCRFDETNHKQLIDVIDADGTVIDSYFCNVHEGDAIDFNGVTSACIKNNIIEGSLDDGIDIDNSKAVLVYGNRIAQCSDKGISVGDGSTEIILERNTIVDSGIGIAVKDGAQVQIDHQTLFQNGTGISAYYDTAPSPAGGTITVTNTIVSGSLYTDIASDEYSQIDIRYSLFDADPPPGTGNISGVPGFQNPDGFNTHLTSASPAINTGDPLGTPDPDGSPADIGAYWYIAQNSSVVINEINYHSADSHDTGDWLELYNCSPHTVNVSGWMIGDSNDSNRYLIPEGTEITAGGYLVICSERTKFTEFYEDVAVIGDMGFHISNSGESLFLYTNQYVMVDSVAFTDHAPWPSEPDGAGPTLALADPYSPNELSSNWMAQAPFGSPGARNDSPLHVTSEKHPEAFIVHQNYPNPFNPATTIGYFLPERSSVCISIYTIHGQRIRTIMPGQQDAGYHEIVFDGSGLSSGVYFYHVSAGSLNRTKRMLLLR